MGDAIHLRGLVEISSRCSRQCAYCGLRAGNDSLTRYRMEPDEILASARQAVAYGYGTVVLQAGEDFGLTCEWVADVVRQIKNETPLAVTLSLGERTEAELDAWRNAGADRYLLRFETSDPELFELIHPQPGPACCRTAFPCSANSRNSATKWAAASWSACRARPTRASPATLICSASWTWT